MKKKTKKSKIEQKLHRVSHFIPAEDTCTRRGMDTVPAHVLLLSEHGCAACVVKRMIISPRRPGVYVGLSTTERIIALFRT